MKKFALKSLVFTSFFALFFLFINVVYLLIIASTDWDFRKRLESINFNNPDFELLVLGASTSLDGIDTELMTTMGIKSYNLALGGSTIRTNYIQLTEYLENYEIMPKYVLLGLNSVHEVFSNENIHPIVEVTMKDHKFGINDAPILKFKWLGFEFLKKVISSKHRNAVLSNGQLKFQKTIPDRTIYITSFLDIDKFESSYWIGEIVKKCTQNGIEIILMELPGYRNIQNLSKTGPHKLNLLNGYTVELYNFNSRNFCLIFDPNKDWIGNSHLNEFGAKKLTQELIRFINNKSNL